MIGDMRFEQDPFNVLQEKVFEIIFDSLVFKIGCISHYYNNPPSIELTPHSHRDFFEIHFLKQGSEICRICTERKSETVVSEGTGIIVPCGLTHSFMGNGGKLEAYALGGTIILNQYENEKNGADYWRTIWDAFNGSNVKHILNCSKIIRIFDDIRKELVFSQNINYLNIKLSIAKILLTIAEQIGGKKEIVDRKKQNDIVYSILEYINNNLKDELRIETLAGVFSKSPRHLTRIFMETTGVSLGTYIRKQRIETAVKMLGETDFSLKEIAMQIGFSSEYNFSTAFRKCTGASPGAYRRKLHDQ